MATQTFRYIDSDAALYAAADCWQASPAVALDTEFSRIDTFVADPALVQIQCDEGCYLLDPLALDDFEPLVELCENPRQVKVLHSCSEDLEVFDSLLGTVPVPLFDTQVAASMLGGRLSLGYQDLVAEVLGIQIPKGETRSDWLQRPLTAAQCEYAALDVSHLLEVYRLQREQLEARGRLEWLYEDCTRLLAQHRARQVPEDYYLRIKMAWKLNRRQLMVLKTICAWRERSARSRNRPRNWVVSDQTLFALAREPVSRRKELVDVGGMSASQVRHSGDELLDLIVEARQVPEEQCPELLPAPLAGRSGARLAELRRVVEEQAANMGVAPEVLARKRSLEDLLASVRRGSVPELPEELRGWREEVIGDPLLALAGEWVGG